VSSLPCFTSQTQLHTWTPYKLLTYILYFSRKPYISCKPNKQKCFYHCLCITNDHGSTRSKGVPALDWRDHGPALDQKGSWTSSRPRDHGPALDQKGPRGKTTKRDHGTWTRTRPKGTTRKVAECRFGTFSSLIAGTKGPRQGQEKITNNTLFFA